MNPSDGGQPQCPCCKECKDCNTGFHKVVNLKDAGLVIYRHTTRTEDVNKDTGIVEFATKTTEDVFILHNTKAIEITSADYLPEIEQNKINCPRCRRIIEHAQKLLQKVPKIDRNDVKGICEHCRNKEAPCFECKEVVKKFVASKTERTENAKERVKQWLSKIKHLLKEAVVDTRSGKERVRAHSELYIDQLCRDSPAPGREPCVKQMFHPETDRSDLIGAFPPPIKKNKKPFGHFEQLEKLERPVVFIDSPGKVGKPSTSRPEGDIFDRDKVNFSDVDSEDLRAMFFSPLSEEDRQREKHVELMDRKHLIPPVPFQSKEDFMIGSDENLIKFRQILTPMSPKSRHKSDEESGAITKSSIKTAKYIRRGDVSQKHKPIERGSDVEPDDYTELAEQRAELATKHLLGSSKPTKGVLRKTGEKSNLIRKYHSEEALLAKIEGVTGDVINQDFSYVFPKILSPDKKQLKHKSSSELIKDTQDMLFAKAEEDKKKLDEERKRKYEEEEKKRIAREARKKQLEDKKLSEALEKKEHQKETKSNTDKEEEKDIHKKDMIIPTASTGTSKSKSKDGRPAKEKEEPKEKELKAPKEPKQSKEDAEKVKREKEERLRKEKQEKEERLKKEKAEKEKLKKEKEEQLRREKEMKQKEKDFKQREKDELQREKGKGDTKQKEKPAPQDDGKREKDEADKRAREEAKLQLKKDRETDIDAKQEPEKQKFTKKIEVTGTKDLNIKSVKVRKSSDDLILQLVKIKQSTAGERQRPKRLEDLNLTSKDVRNHRVYHKKNKMGDCFMCLDSNIELDAESLDLIHDDDGMADIIIGSKIYKYKPPLINRQEELNKPLFFQSKFDDTNAPVEVATSPKNEILSPLPSGKPAQAKHVSYYYFFFVPFIA